MTTKRKGKYHWRTSYFADCNAFPVLLDNALAGIELYNLSAFLTPQEIGTKTLINTVTINWKVIATDTFWVKPILVRSPDNSWTNAAPRIGDETFFNPKDVLSSNLSSVVAYYDNWPWKQSQWKAGTVEIATGVLSIPQSFIKAAMESKESDNAFGYFRVAFLVYTPGHQVITYRTMSTLRTAQVEEDINLR